MAEPLSALGEDWQPGLHGNLSAGVGVTIAEASPAAVVQLAAWPGTEATVRTAIRGVTGLVVPESPGGGAFDDRSAAFGIGPRRYLVAGDDEALAARLTATLPVDQGVVTDLSHGRAALRIEGPHVEWVLAKLFAIDFAAREFEAGAAVSTVHHDIHAHIQRTGVDRFDIYVYRSFARAFATMLRHAAEEVGFEIA